MKKCYKIYRNILSIILTVIILSSSCITSFAVTIPLIGDVNSDQKIDIRDATTLQMYLARLKSLNPIELQNADTNGDGCVSISDATHIQYYLAGFIDELQTTTHSVSLSEIPECTTSPYFIINNNTPFFTDTEKTITYSFEYYSPTDNLGRCQTAYANIGLDLMPSESREDISSVYPSGWKYNGISNNHKYDIISTSNGYIYNRCHLIGFQLAGENANEKNLITGTSYFNTTGMLPFENLIDDYVEETKNHVLYRVTPMYYEKDLVAKGVLMEAWSVEDNGDGICFNVFCYNVQPGIEINYNTGQNYLKDNDNPPDVETIIYILNTNSKKFHLTTCSSISKINEKNKAEYIGLKSDLLLQDYAPCGICKP